MAGPRAARRWAGRPSACPRPRARCTPWGRSGSWRWGCPRWCARCAGRARRARRRRRRRPPGARCRTRPRPGRTGGRIGAGRQTTGPEGPPPPPSWLTVDQRLDVDVLEFRLLEGQQRPQAEAEQARHDAIRELLDADVVDVDGVVVVLAPVAARRLELRDRFWRVREFLVGAQLGVVLGPRERVREPHAHPGLGRAERRHVAGLPRPSPPRAGPGGVSPPPPPRLS